jgi:hypothetical protein
LNEDEGAGQIIVTDVDAPHEKMFEDGLHRQYGDEYATDQYDLNDPTLERFPSDHASILEAVRNVEIGLTENQTFVPQSPVSGGDELSSGTQLNDLREDADDHTRDLSVPLPVPVEWSASQGSIHRDKSVQSLHSITEDSDEHQNRPTSTKSIPVVSVPIPNVQTSAIDLSNTDEHEDEGIALTDGKEDIDGKGDISSFPESQSPGPHEAKQLPVERDAKMELASGELAEGSSIIVRDRHTSDRSMESDNRLENITNVNLSSDDQKIVRQFSEDGDSEDIEDNNIASLDTTEAIAATDDAQEKAESQKGVITNNNQDVNGSIGDHSGLKSTDDVEQVGETSPTNQHLSDETNLAGETQIRTLEIADSSDSIAAVEASELHGHSSLPESVEDTGTSIDEADVATTSRDDSHSSQLRKRVVPSERAATPVSLRSVRDTKAGGNWLSTFFHVLFIDWIGGFITRLCGGPRKPHRNED